MKILEKVIIIVVVYRIMDLEEFVSLPKKCKNWEYYDLKKKKCKRKDRDDDRGGG